MTQFRFSIHRHLLLSLVGREIRARYRGSLLGLFWAVINPVLLMLVYYFVFNLVFRVRLPALYEGQEVPFAGFIFAGLIVHFLFAEVLTRAPGLIQDNANYVKKVVFPLELIPVVMVLGAVFNFLVSLLVLLLFLVLTGHGLSLAVLALPLILLPYLLFLIGMAWLVSGLGVYIRDAIYVAGFLATALMFLSPVFYPMQSVPESFSAVMLFNPLTYFIEAFRQCVIGGLFPDTELLLVPLFSSVVMLVLGYWFFQRVRHGFADIL